VLCVRFDGSPSYSGLASPSPPGGDEPEGLRVEVLEGGADHVRLRISGGVVEREEQRTEQGVFERLSMRGCAWTLEEGKPQIPTRGIFVGVPPEGEVSVRMVDAASREEPIGQVFPVPPQVLDGSPVEGRPLVFDEAVYGTDAFYPASPVRKGESGFIRDQRVVQLSLYPVQYNPVRGRLRVYTRLIVEVTFPPAALRKGVPRKPDRGDGFEPVLRDGLINYEMAKAWRAPAPRAKLAAPSFRSLALKVIVDEDGVYGIGYDELLEAGLDPEDLSPQQLALWNRGEPVPL